jgi:hypothetical protein
MFNCSFLNVILPYDFLWLKLSCRHIIILNQRVLNIEIIFDYLCEKFWTQYVQIQLLFSESHMSCVAKKHLISCSNLAFI